MIEMEKHFLLCLFLVFSFTLQHPYMTVAGRTTTSGDDRLETWGYVEVRNNVHLFWWHYKSSYKGDYPSTIWPTILWLQGGPGGSGVAIGNFMGIGPLDQRLKARRHTWLRKTDILFVDSPAGTGFSYVEDDTLLATSDEEAANELLVLLKDLFNRFGGKGPLFIFGESYGGKIAVILGLAIVKAIHDKELKLTLGGVILGDSWISPEDFVFSWGPLLKDMSRLDNRGLKESNDLAKKIKDHLQKHEYKNAASTSDYLQHIIVKHSNAVNFHDLLADRGSKGINFDIADLMNGVIRRKLKIIPEDIIWKDQIKKFRNAFREEFMKPRIDEVDELLVKGVSVTVYNGQLDLICSTKGAEAWVEKLRWNGLKTYLNLDRVPIYYQNDTTITKGFRRKYENFTFYWILMSGHNIARYQPQIALQMVGEITKSPNRY